MLVGVVMKKTLAECAALFRRPGLSRFDALELRLDVCADFTLDGAASLLAASPRPVIFTLRGRAEGGGFGGSEEDRLDLLEKLIRLEPDGLDVEASAPPERIARLSSLSPSTRLVISRHDFEKTPASIAGLEAMLDEMRRRYHDQAAIYKIATLARNTPDALRMLAFCREQRERGARLTGIAMGEAGQSTRILAGWAHGNYCYCPADPDDAPPADLGQIAAEELCETYNFRRIGKNTSVYGLIGDPVEQSLGHLYHNAANRAAGCDAVYVKWRLRPEELEEAMPLFLRLGVRGLSVTMPLKRAVLSYLNSTLGEVNAIGAANTLRLQSGGWRGLNTDGAGAVGALPFSIQGKTAAILGAGGAARAFMLEASRHGAKLLVFNRSPHKNLPGLPPEQAALPLHRLEELRRRPHDLLVNALPLDADFPFEKIPFRPGCPALDFSYNHNSRFLALAEAAGCPTLDGKSMFQAQAAMQRTFWGLPG